MALDDAGNIWGVARHAGPDAAHPLTRIFAVVSLVTIGGNGRCRGYNGEAQ
jgi:hypothetical protein